LTLYKVDRTISWVQSDFSVQVPMNTSSSSSVDVTQQYDYTTVQRLFRGQSISHYIKFIENSKKETNGIPSLNFKPDSLLSFIPTGTQKNVLRFIDNFLRGQSVSRTLSVRLAVLGPAGTGKTALGRIICKKLKENGKKFAVLGPTGVSSANLGGSTIHSFLNIPYKGVSSFHTLLGSPISSKFREIVRSLDFIIIDECSLVSCELLNYFHLRITRALRPKKKHISYILMGDFFQLPVVCGTPLYRSVEEISDDFIRQGADLFRTFECMFLTENVRQIRDSIYLNILTNIRNKVVSDEDVRLLRTRLKSNLPESIIKEFQEDSTYIFSNNKDCKEYNLKKLKTLNKPIIKILPKQTPIYPLLNEDYTLYITEGCKIQLTSNYNVKAKLCNGTVGTVCKILYDKKNTPEQGIPSVIFCKFEGYNGPTILNMVPIPPISDSIIDPVSNLKYTVKQFGMRLAYAQTGHRTQSLTIPKISVALPEREYFLNYTYSVLSRTSGLDGLMLLDDNITMQRFKSISFYSGFDRLTSELAKLGLNQSKTFHKYIIHTPK